MELCDVRLGLGGGQHILEALQRADEHKVKVGIPTTELEGEGGGYKMTFFYKKIGKVCFRPDPTVVNNDFYHLQA